MFPLYSQIYIQHTLETPLDVGHFIKNDGIFLPWEFVGVRIGAESWPRFPNSQVATAIEAIAGNYWRKFLHDQFRSCKS